MDFGTVVTNGQKVPADTGSLATGAATFALQEERERESPSQSLDLKHINQELSNLEASEIVRWATAIFKEDLVMSTSFGIQSAAMLHLVTQVIPDIPFI